MYYSRIVSEKIQQLCRFFPVIILSGARQTGKTSLLKSLFPQHSYVSLDLPSMADLAERSPERFLSEHPPPVIVDEVQYAPGLFRHLKHVVDQDRHAMGKFILSGSQNFVLMKEVSDSLAGRCGLVELEALSLAELGAPTSASSGIIHLLARGQMPELWRVPDFPAWDFHASYMATYLERDVRQILHVASLRDFERFMRILASRSGAMLNKTDIAKDVGVSVKAVQDWLSVLSASGQVIILEPWFANISKRIVKSPKVYFRDSGLLCFLLGLDESSLPSSSLLGAVWETFIFAEMRKLNPILKRPVNFWYYRDQRAREIDFVVESGGRLSFLEAKWTERPDKSDAGTMVAIADELSASGSSWKAGSRQVVCRTPSAFPLDGVTMALPPGGLKDMLMTAGPRLEGEK